MVIKKIMFLLFPMLVFCFSTILHAQTVTTDDFANQAMLKIKNVDFDKLFDEYVLPKNYTAQNIQSDKEAITKAFKELIQNKIGSLESFAKIESTSEQIVTMDIATGSQETTGNLPSTNVFYKANFSKLGNGYVLIGIYQEGEKLFIKNITIGLPKANPNSVKIVQDLYKFMTDLATEQQKRDPTTPKEVTVGNF